MPTKQDLEIQAGKEVKIEGPHFELGRIYENRYYFMNFGPFECIGREKYRLTFRSQRNGSIHSAEIWQGYGNQKGELVYPDYEDNEFPILSAAKHFVK